MVATVVTRTITSTGLAAVALRSQEVEVLMLPELGSKISSIRDLRTNREWLWQDRSRPPRRAVYGDDYSNYDISGMDECLPTVAPCRYPDGAFAGRSLPDHGDLWSRQWDVEIVDGPAIVTSIDGVCLPYRFKREAKLVGSVFTLRYQLRNLSKEAMRYHWSAHPLFAAEVGMRVEIPGNPRLLREFAIGGRIGLPDSQPEEGSESIHRWPHVRGEDGQFHDLRELRFPTPPATDKVYAIGLVEGTAQLLHPASGAVLSLHWDVKVVPYLAVCTNMGAWPPEGIPGRWIALEPCTATADRLDMAAAQGRTAILAPRGEEHWVLTMRLFDRVA